MLGKIQRKEIHGQQVLAYRKNYSCKGNVDVKKFASSKIPHPPPITFLMVRPLIGTVHLFQRQQNLRKLYLLSVKKLQNREQTFLIRGVRMRHGGPQTTGTHGVKSAPSECKKFPVATIFTLPSVPSNGNRVFSFTDGPHSHWRRLKSFVRTTEIKYSSVVILCGFCSMVTMRLRIICD